MINFNDKISFLSNISKVTHKAAVTSIEGALAVVALGTDCAEHALVARSAAALTDVDAADARVASGALEDLERVLLRPTFKTHPCLQSSEETILGKIILEICFGACFAN